MFYFVLARLVLPCFFLFCFFVVHFVVYANETSTNVVANSSATLVNSSANGIVVVDVATPNANGLSYNQYQNFDVGSAGLILNNFAGNKTDVSNTQLAGLVNVNPNLQPNQEAKIILNEVVSNNPSNLAGYLEVAGKKAEIIIANPYGINFSSAGFLNTNKITAIVGSTLPKSDNWQFDLSSINANFLPSLVIEKNGVDLETVDVANFIANKIVVNGNVYAGENEFSIKSGNGFYDYQANQINSTNQQFTQSQTAIDVANFAQIQAGNIYLITSQDDSQINQQGSLLASKNIMLQGENITTKNTVADFGNINIIAKNLHNTGFLYAKTQQINLDLQNIDNQGSIIAQTQANFVVKNAFANDYLAKITAQELVLSTSNFNNLGNIFSENISLKTTKTNNQSHILANQNLFLQTDNFDNSGSFVAKNNLQIEAKNLFNKQDISSKNGLISANTITNQQNIISAENLDITSNNLQNNQLISAKKFNITAQNIKNTANLEAVELLNINFSSSQNLPNIDGNIISANSLAVNSNAGLINNAKILANNNIEINTSLDFINNASIFADSLNIKTAKNLQNNGEISVNKNLLITANSLENKQKILTASANLTVQNILNHSKLLVANNLNISANNLTNWQIIEVGKDADLSITNNFINQPSALFYAGGNANFLVSNLLYNQSNAIIYANGNLAIQKDANKNNTTTLENEFATIEAGQNISVYAKQVNNRGIDYDADAGGFYGYNVLYQVPQNARGNGFMALMFKDIPISTLRTKQAKITAGENLFINNAIINNYSSSITAKNNIIFNNSSFNNQTSSVLATNLKNTYGKYWHTKSCIGGRWKCKTYYNEANETTISSAVVLSQDVANIKAGDNIIINNAGYVNNGYLNNSLGLKPVIASIDNNKALVDNKTQQLNLDLFIENPLFSKNINTNKPLLETRLQFIDKEQFVASDYFYNKLGIARQFVKQPDVVDLKSDNSPPEADFLPMIGDNFAQNKLIVTQLQNLVSDLDNTKYGNDNYQQIITKLVDNAKIEVERLNLKPNEALNSTQITNLQQDILWFEPKMIQQQKYLTPVVYLANHQAKHFDNSVILADNLNITANENVLNFGNIVVNNLDIAANNLSNNSFAKIIAKQNAVLFANNDLNNFGLISADGNLFLKAKNIINASLVSTNNKNLLQNQFYVNNTVDIAKSSANIIDVAKIEGKNINFVAQQDIKNLSADIVAKNLTMQANDIEIASLSLVNSHEYKIGTGNNYQQKIITQTSNLASNIEALQDIKINANNNFLLSGSNIEAKEDLEISANNQINISSAVDSTNIYESGKQYSSWLKKRFFSNLDIISNKSANLSANNINLSSGDSIYVVASNINADNNLQISAGNSNDSGSFYLLNGVDIVSLLQQKTEVKYQISLENSATTAVAAGAVASVATTGGLSSPVALSAVIVASAVGAINKQKNVSTNFNYQEKISPSTLSFGNNLSLFADNVIISSANLNFTPHSPEKNLANVLVVAKNLDISNATQTNISTINTSQTDNYWAKNGSYGEINKQNINTNIDINGLQQAVLNINSVENIFNSTSDLNNFLAKNHTSLGVNEKTIINSTNRYLTDAGSALVAITATTLTTGAMSGFATAGSGASAGAGAGAASSACYLAVESAKQGAMMATASSFSSATSISAINNEGNLSSTWQDINNKQFAKNLAIAGLSGGLSAGASNLLLSQNGTIINSVNFTDNATNVFAKAGIGVASSGLAFAVVEQKNPSAILQNMAKQEAVLALANLGATEIGNLAHPNNLSSQKPISSSLQLSLHAGVGCFAMLALDKSCLAGGVSAAVGEATADYVYKNSFSSQLAVDFAGLASVVAVGGLDEKNVMLLNRIAQNSASNNAVKVWLHHVGFGAYHTSIKLEPENQAKYANDPRFQNIDSNNKRFATIGAGPDNLDVLKIVPNWLGNLNAGETVLGFSDGINRRRDINITNKAWESANLVPKELDDFYINKLLAINAGYNNKLGYELFPDSRDQNYNSNSYVAGLLNSANIKTDILPRVPIIITAEDLQDYPDDFPLKPGFYFTISKYSTPGYKKLVPSEYFNPLYLNSSIDSNIINEKYVSHL